jgi:hypothetical protein
LEAETGGQAPQPEGARRIGVLQILAANDPDGVAETAAFLQGLAQLGWTDGGNVRIEYRHGLGNPDNVRRLPNALQNRCRSATARSSAAYRGVAIASPNFFPAEFPLAAAARPWAGRRSTLTTP